MKINATITPQLVDAVNHLTEWRSENTVYYIEMLHDIKTHLIFSIGNELEKDKKTVNYLREICVLQEQLKGFIQQEEY